MLRIIYKPTYCQPDRATYNQQSFISRRSMDSKTQARQSRAAATQQVLMLAAEKLIAEKGIQNV